MCCRAIAIQGLMESFRRKVALLVPDAERSTSVAGLEMYLDFDVMDTLLGSNCTYVGFRR